MMRSRLTEADAPEEMLRLVEEELVRRLRTIDGLEIVRNMSRAIAATGGAVPISELDAASHASTTYLAKLFREVIGNTPKRLARIYRFTHTVLSIDVAAPIDRGEVAAHAGYFGQAHFVHEFREYTGLTPTRHVQARRRILREHPDHTLEGWPIPAH